MSLSGYEEDLDTMTEDQTDVSASQTSFVSDIPSSPATVTAPSVRKAGIRDGIENMSIKDQQDKITPTKNARQKKPVPQESPYSVIRRNIREEYALDSSQSSISKQMEDSEQLSDRMDTPVSIKRLPQAPGSSGKHRGKHDPLLHRVLDSNWRLRATPQQTKLQHIRFASSSPISSPHLASQILTSSSPSTPRYRNKQVRSDDEEDGNDNDDESGDLPPGMSPPVTIHFSHPVIMSPAKEAAERMVDEVVHSIGSGGRPSLFHQLTVGAEGSPRVGESEEGTMMGGLGEWRRRKEDLSWDM